MDESEYTFIWNINKTVDMWLVAQAKRSIILDEEGASVILFNRYPLEILVKWMKVKERIGVNLFSGR